MRYAFNYIITIFTHIYTINYIYTNINYILLNLTSMHIYNLIKHTAILFISITQLFEIIPNYTQNINNTNIYNSVDYICSNDVCELNHKHISYDTRLDNLAITIFHLFISSIIPIAVKYIADNATNYILQKIHNLFTYLTIPFLPHQQLQIEDEHNDDQLPNNYHYISPYEYIEPARLPLFPHHISGHIPPFIQQTQSYGQLVSLRSTHTNTQNTRLSAISRVINMSLLSTLLENTNNSIIHTKHDDDTCEGIITHVDPEYVQKAIKTFMSDTCPICMITFPILELNNNTLAATTPCKHLFCHSCINKYINNHSMAPVPCPICRDAVEELHVNK